MGATGDAKSPDITVPEAPWHYGVQGSQQRVSTQVDGAVYTGCGGSGQAGVYSATRYPGELAGHVETGRLAGSGTEIEQFDNGGKREKLRERYDLLPPER